MANVILIARALIALANILPFASALLDQIVSLWQEQQIKKVEGIKKERAKQVKAITNAISKASTNEDRKQLSIILSNYING